tara:strand:+ start:89 stop:964 length:876 start_codon:yes stop_codon:yes gene_type:complete
MCDIPILVINWHGAYFEEEKLSSPIDVVKLNAVSMKVCNLLSSNIANSTEIIIKDVRNKLIKEKGKKNNKTKKTKKSENECNEMVQIIRDELYNLDHLGNRKGKYSRRWLPEVQNAAKYMEDEGDKDGKLYLDNVCKSYRIAKWRRKSLYYEKFFSVHRSEKYSRTNKNDNRMILYYPDGRSEDIFLSFGTKAKTIPDRLKQRKRESFEVYLSDILYFLHDERDIMSVIIIDFSCNRVDDESDISDRKCRQMERSSARGVIKVKNEDLDDARMKKRKTKKKIQKKNKTKKK